jgi:hypothetical protein
MAFVIESGRLGGAPASSSSWFQSSSLRWTMPTQGHAHAGVLLTGKRRVREWGLTSIPIALRAPAQLQIWHGPFQFFHRQSDVRQRHTMVAIASASSGSRGAGPHANTDSTAKARTAGSYQPQNGRARPPLQRQRPGPQRPIDSRQAPSEQHPHPQQRPQATAIQQQELSSSASPAYHSNTALQRPLRPSDSSLLRGSTFPKKTTTVHFCLQYHTQYGQRIRLVGSHEGLGKLLAILHCAP